MTDAQILASISYLDPEPQRAQAEDTEILSIQAASYRACAEQFEKRVMRLERRIEAIRFAATAAAAIGVLAWAAWWAGR